MNPEEDEVDLQLDFYRSDEDSSASEGIDVAFRGEVNDDSGGDDGSDNGRDEPADAYAYGVVFGNVRFGQYEPIAGANLVDNIGDAGDEIAQDNDRLLNTDW